jgi:hypothetical protein
MQEKAVLNARYPCRAFAAEPATSKRVKRSFSLFGAPAALVRARTSAQNSGARPAEQDTPFDVGGFIDACCKD